VRRRRIIAGLLLSLVVAPLAAEAQQAKVYRVGLLRQGAPPPSGTRGLVVEALHDLGYIEGRKLVLDRRWAQGQNERFPDLAAELVALKPDVIVADSTPAAIAAKRATATIPIVMVNVSDPVGSGLVASLARPGSNVTGGTDFGTEVVEKGVEFLHAVLPKATRLAALMSDNPVHPYQLRTIQDAAKKIGLTVLPTTVKTSEDFEKAFSSMAKESAGAFIVLGGAPFSTEWQRDKIVALAAKAKLPAMYPSAWFVEGGGLLRYGQSNLHKWRMTATYVDRILKGAKPADLPVQQPTEIALTINLKTAKALGLTIPPSLLLRADQVIE
jgi:putative ABC transport system substrate-binding protein